MIERVTASAHAMLVGLLLAAVSAPALAQRTPQFVVFTAAVPETAEAGIPFNVFAAASSGLPVTFSVTAPCELHPILDSVVGRAPGTCTLTASQAGNETFEPASASATVGITPALALRIEGPLFPATGQVMRTTLGYTDNGPVREGMLCAIDWGDPAAPGVQLGTPRSDGFYTILCDFEHAYAATGQHRVHGVVYDPRVGYVLAWRDIHVNRLGAWSISGGGDLFSPAGTFRFNPAMSGRVSLRVDLGPAGEDVWFALESPFARFDVVSFGPVPLVTETRAELRGRGTDHTGTEFLFAISILDGGGTGPDRVRLKLWNGSAVVYDTQPGDPDGVPPTTPIDGSIVITPLG